MLDPFKTHALSSVIINTLYLLPMAPINTAFNNLYAALITEVSTTLKTENLLTDEIETILENLKTNAKTTTKKAAKKNAPKRGMNGYNLFMKENRADMAEKKPGLTPQQMTGELAKVWKELEKEKKEDYNARAKAMSPASSDSESSSDTEKKPKSPKKAKSEAKPKAEAKPKSEAKPKAPKAEKKPKSPKKTKAPPPPPVESEEEIEEASSDIDI